MAKMVEAVKAAGTEMFMIEYDRNGYKPAPPEGWCAFRSQKRRVFMKMSNGDYPVGDAWQHNMKTGQFVEHPL